MIKLIKSTFYNEKETKKEICNFIENAEILSMGKKCLEFESKFSEYQNRKYSVFFNSGSSANLALIQTLKNLELIKDKDKVGFSALTWATNVMPLTQLNLTPVPIDVDLNNLNVNSNNLLEVLEKTKLKVLFITNLLGFCGDIEEIKKICKEKNIILLEDNCESLGSEINNKKLGNFGLASTFSFFVGHHMSTIEGGMVCTDSKKLYEMLLMVRSHGWSRNISEESKQKLKKENKIDTFYNQYTFYHQGYNLRPTEINAVIGINQLQYIENIHKIRNKNYKIYKDASAENPDFNQLNTDHMTFVSNFAFPVICKDEIVFNKYLKIFQDNEIEIRPIVGGNITEQPFFKKLNIKNSNKCPNSQKIHELGFYVPNNPELTEVEINKIKNILHG